MTMKSNSNKQQFIEAVELLVPGNQFIAAAARHVPPEILPSIAGVAALEFASTLDILCKSWRLRRPLESPRGARRLNNRGAGQSADPTKDSCSRRRHSAHSIRSKNQRRLTSAATMLTSNG